MAEMIFGRLQKTRAKANSVVIHGMTVTSVMPAAVNAAMLEVGLTCTYASELMPCVELYNKSKHGMRIILIQISAFSSISRCSH